MKTCVCSGLNEEQKVVRSNDFCSSGLGTVETVGTVGTVSKLNFSADLDYIGYVITSV